jgi:peroxiredoxin
MLVIAHGDADANLRLAGEHKWRCDVVLDSTGQVTRAYKIGGTPSGYLLDANGQVASQLAEGADALLGLVPAPTDDAESLTSDSLRQKEQTAVERARRAGLSVRESGLNRQGLDPGTVAPEFALSDLEGVQRSLNSFLDKRVLLVFSDPNCGPCEALAPDLVRLHRHHADNNLRVVMISRGDPQANLEKARKHEFPFPVLLQKHWEISKDYAMFATPIGYLINRDGTIARPVAVGSNAILDLIDQ